MFKEHDQTIADFLGECIYDPLKHVMGSYPWATDESIRLVPLAPQYRERFPQHEYGPDVWQCEYLDRVGELAKQRAFNGKDPVAPIRKTLVSGHGIGKTTLTAWLTKWILDTRPLSVGTVTANTASQLRTKTWSEIGKWHNLSLTRDWFRYTNTSNEMSLVHVDPTMKTRWKAFAITCDPKNSEAFAGQHTATSTSFYIFDEASKIADTFFEVREGGMSKGEPMAFDFGNGTRNTGRFFENCSGRFKAQYEVTSIDSRSAHAVNKDKIQQEVDVWGEDSDYIRVRVRGLFPSKGDTQFISSEAAEIAMRRDNTAIDPAANLVIGVDVARAGKDSSVIYPRLGWDARSFKPRKFHNLDTVQLAHEVVQLINEFADLGIHYSHVFVDGGGGYGGGVVDQLRRMNVSVTEVIPNQTALLKQRYALRIDEMWGGIRDNIERLVLPEFNSDIGRELFEELTQRLYGTTLKGQDRLEAKEYLRERIGRSPDYADALALTFAVPQVGFNSGVTASFVAFDDEDARI